MSRTLKTVPLAAVLDSLPAPRRASVAERFWSKVDRTPEGCWLWTSATDRDGYGVFWLDAKHRAVRAHRLSHALTEGAIPSGMVLDHQCETRNCVNPSHLVPCTSEENVARSEKTPYRVKARQTHCKRGHEFTAENTVLHGGRRECRACTRAAQKIWRELRKAAAARQNTCPCRTRKVRVPVPTLFDEVQP